ncbi:polyisoprenoid-binding protein [Lysobacter concretionis Ko07 = DSM 16239]|jgi:polyisoprenoid-binding protein YceI|uniref:Polyisoprenoid-binding protein n=2 Tax=Lysobacteraceae TaxID=32033 RepID=A0A0A0ENZ9_9GAMM|nr:polyisoprenoid-binding protein [Lysobacter concretionis Ko07 = DSM 16239]QOD90724.1 YceI family protein [Lysobacter sp. CW239]
MFKRLILATALAAAGTAAFAAPVTYQMDPAHTDVIAQWSHFGFSNPSMHFGQADGVLVYDADNVAASSVQVTLPLSSMNSFTAKFDEHLRSADFFDAAKFPSASFKSTQVEAAGEGRLKVTGELTIKGITKPVVLDVTLNKVGENMMKQPTIGFDAVTTIKRTDFDVGMYAPAVSDEVRIRITTEASVPKAE